MVATGGSPRCRKQLEQVQRRATSWLTLCPPPLLQMPGVQSTPFLLWQSHHVLSAGKLECLVQTDGRSQGKPVGKSGAHRMCHTCQVCICCFLRNVRGTYWCFTAACRKDFAGTFFSGRAAMMLNASYGGAPCERCNILYHQFFGVQCRDMDT